MSRRFSFTVEADSFEDAIAKLVADYEGDDCPCGLPTWGVESAIEVIREHGTMEGFLCMCVGERSTYVDDVYTELVWKAGVSNE